MCRWGFTSTMRFLTCVFGSVPLWWMTWLSESRLQDGGCPILLSRSMVTRLIREWQPSELTETQPIFHRTSITSNVRFRKATVLEQTHEEATIGQKYGNSCCQHFLNVMMINRFVSLFRNNVAQWVRMHYKRQKCLCVCARQSNDSLVMAWLGLILSLGISLSH